MLYPINPRITIAHIALDVLTRANYDLTWPANVNLQAAINAAFITVRAFKLGLACVDVTTEEINTTAEAVIFSSANNDDRTNTLNALTTVKYLLKESL